MKKNKVAESWGKIELNSESDKRILNQLVQLNSNHKKEEKHPQMHFAKKSFVPVLVPSDWLGIDGCVCTFVIIGKTFIS